MAKVIFTPNIQRHVECPESESEGNTVGEALEKFFAKNRQARSYILDDQAGVRKHITIFVDGHAIRDRKALGDRVSPDSTIYVFQALSGG